jgi:hypothetical protein
VKIALRVRFLVGDQVFYSAIFLNVFFGHLVSCVEGLNFEVVCKLLMLKDDSLQVATLEALHLPYPPCHIVAYLRRGSLIDTYLFNNVEDLQDVDFRQPFWIYI